MGDLETLNRQTSLRVKSEKTCLKVKNQIMKKVGKAM